MYAVMEDYQESVIHYTHALRLQPDFDEAKLRRNAVVCQVTDELMYLTHKCEKRNHFFFEKFSIDS